MVVEADLSIVEATTMQIDAIKHEEVEPASSLDGSQGTLDEATDVKEETVNVELAVLVFNDICFVSWHNSGVIDQVGYLEVEEELELLSLGAYHLRYCQVIESFAMTPRGTFRHQQKKGQNSSSTEIAMDHTLVGCGVNCWSHEFEHEQFQLVLIDPMILVSTILPFPRALTCVPNGSGAAPRTNLDSCHGVQL
ncbi:hypothetical protein KY284_020979 [Solanum tuberosum]|nr:hypothetical protein KY284_020979 [Solanum tuberosum]